MKKRKYWILSMINIRQIDSFIASIKLILAIFFTLLTASCAANNVNDLKRNSNAHYVYYYNGDLDDIFNQVIDKCNECGVPVSNTFINRKLGKAGVSYTSPGYGWYAHSEFKREDLNSIKIDVYSVINKGIPGNFVKITKHAIESKVGCPNDLF